jgi:hypothetical protein
MMLGMLCSAGVPVKGFFMYVLAAIAFSVKKAVALCRSVVHLWFTSWLSTV